MTDLEERLSATLAEHAGTAPSGVDLVAGARQRHRRRRIARGAGAGVAVVAVAVAVPLGLNLGGVDKSEGGFSKQPPPTVQTIPADWRFESYRSIELAVPPSWGHGSLSDWCANDGQPEPRVERPGGLALSILCAHSGYGVAIGRVPSDPPAGATVREVTVDDITVAVVAQDAETADAVIASVRSIPGEDFYGCEPAKAVPPLGEMKSSSALGREGIVSTCRYAIGVEGPNLIGGEGIPADDTESFWLGLESAEPGKGPDNEVANCATAEAEAVLVNTGMEDYAWVHYDGCYGHGIDVGGTTYKLNAQVTYWTLPRGGFAVDESVPLPKEQRR